MCHIVCIVIVVQFQYHVIATETVCQFLFELTYSPLDSLGIGAVIILYQFLYAFDVEQ
jgi:hypothetical protein